MYTNINFDYVGVVEAKDFVGLKTNPNYYKDINKWHLCVPKGMITQPQLNFSSSQKKEIFKLLQQSTDLFLRNVELKKQNPKSQLSKNTSLISNVNPLHQREKKYEVIVDEETVYITKYQGNSQLSEKIDKFFSRYVGIQILAFEEIHGNHHEIDYEKLHDYVSQANYIDDVMYIDDVKSMIPKIRYRYTDISDMYAFIAQQLLKNVSEDFTYPNQKEIQFDEIEIDFCANRFKENFLHEDFSVDDEHIISTFKTILDLIDHNTAYKNTYYSEYFDAIDEFLTDYSVKPHEEDRWGVSDFSLLWEDMVKVFLCKNQHSFKLLFADLSNAHYLVNPQDHGWTQEIQDHYQSIFSIKASKNPNDLFSFEKQIKPDFVIQEADGSVSILDAKYSTIDALYATDHEYETRTLKQYVYELCLQNQHQVKHNFFVIPLLNEFCKNHQFQKHPLGWIKPTNHQDSKAIHRIETLCLDPIQVMRIYVSTKINEITREITQTPEVETWMRDRKVDELLPIGLDQFFEKFTSIEPQYLKRAIEDVKKRMVNQLKIENQLNDDLKYLNFKNDLRIDQILTKYGKLEHLYQSVFKTAEFDSQNHRIKTKKYYTFVCDESYGVEGKNLKYSKLYAGETQNVILYYIFVPPHEILKQMNQTPRKRYIETIVSNLVNRIEQTGHDQIFNKLDLIQALKIDNVALKTVSKIIDQSFEILVDEKLLIKISEHEYQSINYLKNTRKINDHQLCISELANLKNVEMILHESIGHRFWVTNLTLVKETKIGETKSKFSFKEALTYCNELSASLNLVPAYKLGVNHYHFDPNANGFRLMRTEEFLADFHQKQSHLFATYLDAKVQNIEKEWIDESLVEASFENHAHICFHPKTNIAFKIISSELIPFRAVRQDLKISQNVLKKIILSIPIEDGFFESSFSN